MKKLYLSILVLFCFIALSAQAPQSFRYQTVVRNTAGELLADHQVGLKISILKSSPTGYWFLETYSLITTAQGLISLSVGTEIRWQGPWNILIGAMALFSSSGRGY
jgi:hypothetical protein